MRILQSILLTVEGIILGTGIISVILAISRNKTKEISTSIKKESFVDIIKDEPDLSTPISDPDLSLPCISNITCLQDITLKKDDFTFVSSLFKEDRCGNAKNLSPQILSYRCRDIINRSKNDLYDFFDLDSCLLEIIPRLCDDNCFNLSTVYVIQHIYTNTYFNDFEDNYLNCQEILQLDSSNVNSMDRIEIIFNQGLPVYRILADKKTNSVDSRILSNEEKALIIRYIQARFLHETGEV